MARNHNNQPNVKENIAGFKVNTVHADEGARTSAGTVMTEFVFRIYTRRGLQGLTHSDLVTPYGNGGLGQHWFRQWLVAWRHQAIAWTNVVWSLVKSRDIHIREISQEMPQPSITKIRLKITYLKFHSNFPGSNELKGRFRKTGTDLCVYEDNCVFVFFISSINTTMAQVVQIILPPKSRTRWFYMVSILSAVSVDDLTTQAALASSVMVLT